MYIIEPHAQSKLKRHNDAVIKFNIKVVIPIAIRLDMCNLEPKRGWS